MKDLWKSGLIVLIVIGALYIIFLRECKHTQGVNSDEIVIKRKVWDSIQLIAHKPPVVSHDTFYTEAPIVYVPGKPIPTPVHNNDSTNSYTDSIVNKEINVGITLKTKGTLVDLFWKYKPIVKVIRIDSTIYVPQIVNNPVPIQKRGFYVSANMGGNANSFLFGGGIDYITKKNTEFGYIYQRFGGENFHSFKLGIKLGK
jgi:hypothetical protein